MAEYIEREEIRRAYEKLTRSYVHDDPYIADWRFDEMIENLTASDVATVRHGRWEAMHYEGGILDGTNFDKCSVCGYERVFEDENLKTAFVYCPACGARMDKEDSQCDT